MDTCACGMALRRFWLWRDTNDTLHASAFRPTSGAVRAVLAANARDALLPLEGGIPKHDVQDADDPSVLWEGRCARIAASA